MDPPSPRCKDVTTRCGRAEVYIGAAVALRRAWVLLLAAAASIACAVNGCDANVIVGRRIVPEADAGTEAGEAMDAGAETAAATDADAGGEASADADATADAADAADAANTAADATRAMDADAGGEGGADSEAGGDAAFCSQANSDAAVTPDPDAAVLVPWSTGFENGFCDYAQPFGFCFQTGIGSYSIVTSPVHWGRYAAAFTVRGDIDGGSQVRCVEQGVFPAAAYYGAWYYLPASATNSGVWNLFHYQGGVAGQVQHGLWDLSLINLSDGGVRITLFDFLNPLPADAGTPPPFPIAQWVHLEVYFKRAKDKTGEVSMFQDGVLAVRLANVVTDDTDWGQWYVGNLANALMPGLSTVYVDDVTISFTLDAGI